MFFEEKVSWGWIAVLLLSSLFGLRRCNLPSNDFVSISEHGFDTVDNAEHHNDYPWAMNYFQPDGAETGHLYVGTGNCVMRQIMYFLGVRIPEDELFRPPEILRYRPDLGPKQWEVILDYADVEEAPNWETSGFRAMTSYRSPIDGVQYLYVGTLGLTPALWRSPTAEPGSWEQVWTSPDGGSIRALHEHNGLLYIAVTHEFLDDPLPGEIVVTDGESFELLNGDGFGNVNNVGVYELASFNGWLYAGTGNREDGYEVWKLEGPMDDGPPQPIVTHGGPSNANIAAGTMCVFQDRLYVGGLIFGGVNLNDGFIVRGADLIRIASDDSWEVISGPGSITGLGSGMGKRTNAYLWSLEEYEGALYCGTWDAASFVRVSQQFWPEILATVDYYQNLEQDTKRRPGTYDILTGNGADLYRSQDGVHWQTVFRNGLGNPDNYGVRNMVAVGDVLYLGLSNIYEGLEVFRTREE